MTTLAVDYGQGVENAWSNIATFIPKAVAFLVILLVGYIIAKVVMKAVDALLERVGFDKAVEKTAAKKAMEKSKYDASDIVAKLAFYAVVLFALTLAFGVFGPTNPVSRALESIVSFLPDLAVAIIIVGVAAFIAKAVKDLVTNALGGLSYGKALGTVASVFILGLGIIAALNEIGVATTVTTPLLVFVLATVGGILVVGVGGGLIKPMQGRWEQMLNKAEEEAPKVKQQAQQSKGASSAGDASVYPTDPTVTQPVPVAAGAARSKDATTVMPAAAPAAKRARTRRTPPS